MPSDKLPKNSIEKSKKEELENSVEEDLEMHRKIKEFKSDPEYLEKLSLEDFKSYFERAKNFNEDFISSRKGIKDPARYEFWTFLTQKWSPVWLNIQTEEYKRKRNIKKINSK